MTTAITKVNGQSVDEPRFDPTALAEADAVRTRAKAEAEALRIEAQGKADAEKIKAAEEAERQRITNERNRLKLEKDQAAHNAYIAEQKRRKEAAEAATEKARKATEEEEAKEAALVAEQQRSERIWKWGARGIYAVGLIIAAPIQFLAFWDKERPFLVAAPALLEGLALAMAFGAAWAVAHRRDVMPYRIGIMIGACIAAGINLWHGIDEEAIGINAGIIGALASLGGPIILMAYEHGIAQKADGIPSWRERRAADRKAKEEAAERARAKQEKADAETRAAKQKADQQLRADVEQTRKDEDRRKHHKDVWEVAEALRSARGSQYVTEQIWADAWYRVTGSKVIGVRPEMEAESRAAQARMKTITELPVMGASSQVSSQKAPRAKKDPEAPDGRRFNGGTPPLRRVGDALPYCDAAKKQAALEQADTVAANKTI